MGDKVSLDCWTYCGADILPFVRLRSELPMATDWTGRSQVVTVRPLDYSTQDYSSSMLMMKYGFNFLGGLTYNSLIRICEVNPSTIQYCDRTILSRMFGLTGLVGISSLKRGDILLQVNDVKVSGMSTNHVEALLFILHKRGEPVRLTTARPLHHSHAVYHLTKYASHCSEQDSPEFKLRDVICDNALVFHPPLSTRPMRDDEGETQGNPYHFLSEAQFSALQRRDDLLAAGQYDG